MSKIRERGANAIRGISTKAVTGIQKTKESKILKEFKEFAIRGNVIDLAIGIMVGGGFNKVITSLVNDIILPPIGLVLGRMDFSNLFINLSGNNHATIAAAKEAGDPTLNIGLFFNAIIDFTIIAIVTFFVVRQINRWKRKEEPKTRECPRCFSDINKKAIRCPFCTSELKSA